MGSVFTNGIARTLLLSLITMFGLGVTYAGENLIEDPSFEMPKEADQFGLVFEKWGGWKYEGDCKFAVGGVSHGGETSCLLIGRSSPKIRIRQEHELEPGRYRVTAFLRGLDIATGVWDATTEFMFNEQYIQLQKNGTFGWTKLTYVGQVNEKNKVAVSFGLMAPGYFWIDDVTLEKVGPNTPLTEKPILGEEEAPIAPPGEIGSEAVQCPECGYRNMPAWKTCYGCGTPLEDKKTVANGPPIKLITSFEGKNPFGNSVIVTEHATDGLKAMRIDRSYADMHVLQDWTGYDYLKADLYTDAKDPLKLYVEIRDTATQGYWTRVNYHTVVPPGRSTLVLPIKQLYVGEKSRPGRMLILNGITRFVLSIGDKPSAPLYVDNIRIERDESAENLRFEGLHAFDFGMGSSPVMEGFTQITPATIYSKGRGYGLKDAKIWRAYDVLQPDPLYQDFLCIESGGLDVDVPNGKYRVFVNMDNPSGFWGEYQIYRKRAIMAQGSEILTETMNFDTLKKKYFRFWNVEDLPTDDTFDKYQREYFQEKIFDVDVTNGLLSLDFKGANWACSVSAVVIYPLARTVEGDRFLEWVENRRRFHFNNYFKRVLHNPTGDPLKPTDVAQQQGYVVFCRDFMKDLYYNDTPFEEEIDKPFEAKAFAGQYESVTVGILPLRDLGSVTVKVSDLVGLGGIIPSDAIEVAYISYRLSRVTMEGTVYTIKPRLIMPTNTVTMPKDVARRFWLTVKTPVDTKPGLYRGQVKISPEQGLACSMPIEFSVRKGSLDSVDIPVGPWGYKIDTPWYGDDPGAKAFNREITLLSLKKMREYGFTMFSGIPTVHYKGFKEGQPILDFSQADEQMQMARDLGFLAVCSYGSGVTGLNAYYQDTDQMKAAGFDDYSAFIKTIYTAIQNHADEHGWLPTYWNLADEPIGDDLKRSIENAAAYRKAFPKGPPFFTGASSFSGSDSNDPHFQLAKSLQVVDWNNHDEEGVHLLHEAGGNWAFYNGGNRWTYGDYLYKAAKQFGMKFRLSWHWNVTAGDPYYALDCREDDYAWCNATPDGRLVPSVEFERRRAGLDDYCHLLTLARLANEKSGSPAGQSAKELIASRLASFRLGQREHDRIFGLDDWQRFRRKVADLIERLR